MPKKAQYTLTWSDEQGAYELRDREGVAQDGNAWTLWLTRHGSFSFRGQAGKLNLLKEARKGGDGYWYAYRRNGAHTVKRYAGRSAELTFGRLEEIAAVLAVGDAAPSVVPQTDTSESAVARAQQTGQPEETFARQTPLLTAKIQPPRLHSALVRRERLLARLQAGRDSKLTVVSAPAGFGKTTLVLQWLAEWARQDQAPAVAWLSLDTGDNDPVRFWRYLIAACRALGPEVGEKTLALLETPLAIKSPLEMALTTFLNELTLCGREGVLVLEDYHVITAPQIHEAIGFLIDHLPANLRVLLITRVGPPLPLARLRAAGELTEIEAVDLRFSDAETAAFLQQSTALGLPRAALAQVEARIEGWPAGLRLLSVALEGWRDEAKVAEVLQAFTAGQREIQDYFVGEVLNSQPEALQLFLLQTSVLSSLTASLCDSVTGRDNSQAMLETLDRANLFLEPLDTAGTWYRYHSLFAAAMRNEAQRRLGNSALLDLLARASRWYEEHAMPAEAIEAAFAAADPCRAAALIEHMVAQQFSYEIPDFHLTLEFHTVRRWLEALPETLLDERPLLHLAHATVVSFIYQMDMRPRSQEAHNAVEASLAKAERGFRTSGDVGRLGQVLAVRSLITRERGEMALAVQHAKAALELLPPQETTWHNICLVNLGIGESVQGHLNSAGEFFAQALALCRAPGSRAFARGNIGLLSWVHIEQGELQRAAAQLSQMLAEAREQGDLDDVGQALQALAEISYEWNDLDGAQRQAAEAVETGHMHPYEPYCVNAVLTLARIEQTRGQQEAALARCAALLAQSPPLLLPADQQMQRRIRAAQARLSLAAGDLLTAQRWLASRDLTQGEDQIQLEREHALAARVHLAGGNPSAALQLLEPLLAAAEAGGHARVALEARVLLALTTAARGQARQARQTLTEALAVACAEGYIRSFVDEGEPLMALLRATLPTLNGKRLIAYAKTLLHAATDATPASAKPLSEQERRVLRLIAAGRTNPEIATQLVISVNTVKSHVKSIYYKLDVTNRLEAADAAHRLGLA